VNSVSIIEGATPDAFDRLNQFNKGLPPQSMIAKAVVTNSSTIAALLEQRVQKENYKRTNTL